MEVVKIISHQIAFPDFQEEQSVSFSSLVGGKCATPKKPNQKRRKLSNTRPTNQKKQKLSSVGTLKQNPIIIIIIDDSEDDETPEINQKPIITRNLRTKITKTPTEQNLIAQKIDELEPEYPQQHIVNLYNHFMSLYTKIQNCTCTFEYFIASNSAKQHILTYIELNFADYKQPMYSSFLSKMLDIHQNKKY